MCWRPRRGCGHNRRVIVDVATYVNGRRRPSPDFAAAVADLKGRDDGFIWVGMHEPTAQEFVEVADGLGLHLLAVEDAVSGHQRPKLETYASSLFLVVKTLSYVADTSDIETGEIMVFLGRRFVVTVRRGTNFPLTGVRRGLEDNPQLLGYGPAVVLHAVLDAVVDGYVRIDAELQRDLDRIEGDVFQPSKQADVAFIYSLKREVLEFRRAAYPLADPARRLASGDLPFIPQVAGPYFRDVYDHVLRVVEHVEAYDRLLSDVLSAHLAQVSVQQNTDMRKISAWVAIAAYPTMLAGIYGMNFEYMPELHLRYGYPVLLTVIIVGCLLLHRGFRRAGWL